MSDSSPPPQVQERPQIPFPRAAEHARASDIRLSLDADYRILAKRN